MKSFLILILVFAFGYELTAQQSFEINLCSEEKIKEWLSEYNVPAVGIGIIENSRIKEIKVLGELQQGIDAPKNTIFNIASQTKPVVAMLTLKLIDSGQWKLDEPISDYWVDPDVINDTLHHMLTTRNILCHQTGFANWRINEPSKKLTFNFKPGTKFQYSGEGYEYLKRALENKFKKSLINLLDSVLFDPLEMTNTQYWNDNLDLSRFACWHDAQGEKYLTSYQTGISAADDLLTTIEDYCKFGIDVMNGAGISDELYIEMITPQSFVKEDNYYGLGWGLVTDLSNGEYALHHGGSDVGVRNMAIFLPETQRGIVVMTNGDMGMLVFNNIITESIDVGEEVLNTINKSVDARQSIVLPDQIIDSYVGIYQQAIGRFVNVAREDNSIVVSGDGLPTAKLFPESENSFFLEDFDVRLEFIQIDSESPMHLIIYENGKQILDIQRIQ